MLSRKKISLPNTWPPSAGHNDLPMFERVGVAIAMDNASQDIKDRADLITKSNDEDGVGQGIHTFLL